MTATPVLEMRHIAKAFGKFYALKGVDLTVWPGEIHALMGENGAGKSTLMKILAGAYTATSGEILIDGKPQTIRGPKDALAAGITLIYRGDAAGAEPDRRGKHFPRQRAGARWSGAAQSHAQPGAGGDRPSRRPVQSQRPGDDPDHRRTTAGGDRPRPAPSKPHSGDG